MCLFPRAIGAIRCIHLFIHITDVDWKPTYYACSMLSCFSGVWLFATLWTIAHQAPLSVGFSRQEYWRGLPCPPPGVEEAGGFFTRTTWQAPYLLWVKINIRSFWKWKIKLECCCCCITSVVSYSVQPHRWQPTRLPHPWDSPGKNTGVGCHFLLQCRKVKRKSEVAQLWLTLSDPMDCSLPGFSIHGIFQAWVLDWVAIAWVPWW